MIKLPDFDKAFEHENNFYLSCGLKRISKFAAHHELFKMVADLPGQILECGVFKGASFVRFAMFRSLFGNVFSKKLIGFDTFGRFPDTEFETDIRARAKFISAAGEQSISEAQLLKILKRNSLDKNVELVSGNICDTIPKYVEDNPQLKLSLVNLDTDIYEPAVTILNHLWPRIVKGGILIVDDYGVFPGETKAIDDFFKNSVRLQKFPFAMTPTYIVKE